MTQPTLSQINVYPIKSCAGISLTTSLVEQMGLEFDRRFVLTKKNGQFITARTDPKLCLVKTAITEKGIYLNAPEMPELVIKYADFKASYQTVQVWSDNINGQYCHALYDRWFSQYLGKKCKLFYFGERTKRRVKNSNSQVSFADGYPFLLTSQQSLDELNSRLDTPIAMTQFRPNLVVDNCPAFAEDGWKNIQIGEVEFAMMKPCSRCIFTTVNPLTAEKHINQEPLTTLQTYRKDSSGDVMFGQNLIALNSGQINLHDPVTVSHFQTRPVYIDLGKNHQSTMHKPTPRPLDTTIQPLTLTFSSWDLRYQGNNQDSILEQSEAAGLDLPYSCRAGICGQCKVKLVSGEIAQLNEFNGLTAEQIEQRYILACSCVPSTDVVIETTESEGTL